MWRFFPSLNKFIPKCFIVFDVIVNGIFLFISDNLYWSIERLLIYMLILYAETLLSLLVRSDS